MRPLRVARHQHLLPRIQPSIALAQQPAGLSLEPADLLGDIEPAIDREVAQLFDLAFELGDRPFEIEKMAHRRAAISGSRRALSTPPSLISAQADARSQTTDRASI